MNVTDCLNDIDTTELRCQSDDSVKSTCTCKKKNHKNHFQFDSSNSDLYLDWVDHDPPDMNLTDRWSAFTAGNVSVCIKENFPLSWNCTTDVKNLNLTFCYCFCDQIESFDSRSVIETKSLYKGLEDMIFPFHPEQEFKCMPDPMLHHLKCENSIEIDESIFYKFLTSTYFYAFFFMLTILLLIIAISWVLKDKIHLECQTKEENDIIPFIDMMELEIQY